MLPVEDEVPGLMVRGRLLIPDYCDSGPQGLAIIIPGFLGYMDWGFYPYLAKILTDKNWMVILFNHSTGGTGDNGKPYSGMENLKNMTVERDLADVRGIFEALDKDEIPGFNHKQKLPIFLIGHSKGGAVSILSAVSRPDIAGIVLINSVADLLRIPREKAMEIIERGYQEKMLPGTKITIKVKSDYWKQLIENPDRYDVPKALGSLKAKIYVIRGADDEIIPFEETNEIIKHAPNGAKIMLRSGVGHNLGCENNSSEMDRNAYTVMFHVAKWMDEVRSQK